MPAWVFYSLILLDGGIGKYSSSHGGKSGDVQLTLRLQVRWVLLHENLRQMIGYLQLA
jgi:hypothetical protein